MQPFNDSSKLNKTSKSSTCNMKDIDRPKQSKSCNFNNNNAITTACREILDSANKYRRDGEIGNMMPNYTSNICQDQSVDRRRKETSRSRYDDLNSINDKKSRKRRIPTTPNKSNHGLIHTQIDELENNSETFSEACLDIFEIASTTSTNDTDFLGKFANLPQAKQIVSKENEKILQNIFSIDITSENNVDLITKEAELDSGVRLITVMKDLMNKPNSENIDMYDNLIALAKKRRKKIVNENKIATQIENNRLAKEKELTFKKLLELEDKSVNDVESMVDKLMHDLETQSTVLDDESMVNEELLYPEDFCIDQEEIIKILEQCSGQDVEIDNEFLSQNQPTIYTGQDNATSNCIDATYSCHACGNFSTTCFSDFYNHLSNHHRELVIKNAPQLRQKCMVCGYIVPKADFLLHLNGHKTHTRCKICDEFVLREEFEVHLSSHSKHFSCSICGEVYKTITAVRKHVTHHRKGSQYSCDQCHHKYPSLEKLVRHISLQHESIHPYYAECPYCFELTDNIKNHIYSHGLCKLKCKVCRMVCKQEQDFIIHMKQHTSDYKNRPPSSKYTNILSCSECGLRISDLCKLRHHLICHQADALYAKHFPLKGRYKCDLCQLIMPQAHSQYHSASHRYYKRCLICAAFVIKNDFAEHLRIHEHDCKCEICDEVFSDEKRLENHRWGHGRLIQRPCTHCHLQFNSEVARIKHISFVHKNIDPEFVECPFCKEILVTNIEFHLLDLNYCQRRCKLCDIRFKTARDYLKHVQKVHEDILENPVQ